MPGEVIVSPGGPSSLAAQRPDPYRAESHQASRERPDSGSTLETRPLPGTLHAPPGV